MQVVSGDVDVYAELMGRYEKSFFALCWLFNAYTRSYRDVVQDSFIKAYQNLSGFNPKYKFSTWIYRIAHNGVSSLRKLALKLTTIWKKLKRL